MGGWEVGVGAIGAGQSSYLVTGVESLVGGGGGGGRGFSGNTAQREGEREGGREGGRREGGREGESEGVREEGKGGRKRRER